MRAVALVAGLVGCADRPPPLVEGHRTGAGYWPENSEYGLQQAMALGLDGIEVDLVLTRDLVPVLHHDPSVSTAHCTLADGSRFQDDVHIRDIDVHTLQRTYLCGGVRVRDFPQAAVVAEPIVTFDRMLELLREQSDPGLLVHLDIKQEPGLTLPPSAFAEAIVGRWVAADLPHRVHVSSNLPDVLAAFRAAGAERGVTLETTLIWPRFPVGASIDEVALRREGALLVGSEDYVAIAREADVDHLAIAWELADEHLLSVAHREGVGIMVWTPNDPVVLDRLARSWPVDVVITDFPGDLR